MPAMPGLTNFPGGFSAGLTVRGMPILQTNPGNFFWVYSGTILERATGEVAGSDSNRGTFQRPFATLAGALAQCTPGKGDVIIIKPGHQETITSATQLLISCSDVAIVGLGAGLDRPMFTLSTAATATIGITGSNISIQNCQFVANFLNITSLFTFQAAVFTASISGNTMTVTAVSSGTIYPGDLLTSSLTGFTPNTAVIAQISGTTGGVGVYTVSGPNTQSVASGTINDPANFFAMDNCEVRDTSSVLNFLSIATFGTTNNLADGFTLTNNRILLAATSGAINLFTPTLTMDRVRIEGNYYASPTTNAGAMIPLSSGKVLTNVSIQNNQFNLANAAGTATGIIITTNSSTNSGIYNLNTSFALPSTALLITASSGFMYGQNWHTHTPDKTPQYLPTQAA